VFKRKYYYDACTLDLKETYPEIIKNRKKFQIESLVSHLSLGEALGNCHMKGETKFEAFVDLIKKILAFVTVVGNDNIERQTRKITEIFPTLSSTDSMHVATALKHSCEILRTTDPDLYNQNKIKVRELGRFFGNGNFCLSRMDLT